ncbi:MAG TPA: EamA family transporter [Candidatus Dormibacteraeota bacterium]|nr:EamA family transporter [Candidatus Dormibacteraeota bacterium]
MILAAIGLALAAAAVHGTWNVLVKVSGDPLTTFQRATLLAVVIGTVPVAIAWFAVGRPAINPAAAGFAVLSAVFELAYLWLLSAAYGRGELSVVYPIARGSAPLLAVVIGIVILGERLTGLQLAGVVLLLGGILAVTLPQTSGRATLPALMTGVAIAAYTAVDRVGVRLTVPWLYGWMLVAVLALFVTVTLPLAERFHIRPDGAARKAPSIRQAAIIGVFMWGGYLLVLLALYIAPLSVVAPVRETAVVAVALWGVWKLRERRAAALKIAGAGATLIGVSLLAL